MFAAWCLLAAKLEENFSDMSAYDFAQFRALGSSFGMNPSSRAKLRIPQSQYQPEQPQRSPNSKVTLTRSADPETAAYEYIAQCNGKIPLR
jgi:hypothetical protein